MDVLKSGLCAVPCLALLMVIGCADATNPPGGLPDNGDLSREWPSADPAELGFDPTRLDLAFHVARSRPYIRSLLVFRNGYFVRGEHIAQDADSTLVPLYGATTSVLSALTGIAIAEGRITSVDQSIADFLVPEVVAQLDAGHRAITIRHLLTMTSGLQWQEGSKAESDGFAASPYTALWRYALSKPIVATPGSRINYNSGAASLLAAVVSRAVGGDLLDFARAKLLVPLGIDSIAWAFDGDYRNGGTSIRLTARDAAKLGMLYVNAGFSNGQAVVPAQWIAQSMAPVTAAGVPYRFGPVPAMNLGYLWWLPHELEHPAFFAWGSGGQLIYCVPALKLVAVTTTDGAPLHPDDRDEVEKDMLELIIDRVIPAVVR